MSRRNIFEEFAWWFRDDTADLSSAPSEYEQPAMEAHPHGGVPKFSPHEVVFPPSYEGTEGEQPLRTELRITAEAPFKSREGTDNTTDRGNTAEMGFNIERSWRSDDDDRHNASITEQGVFRNAIGNITFNRTLAPDTTPDNQRVNERNEIDATAQLPLMPTSTNSNSASAVTRPEWYLLCLVSLVLLMIWLLV